ncbi:unnamed protein product [Psylliodes chrysocephalus]|uniref:Uncharacterized protein n=1 Tax=Psylliodes chrysocephalus TaxID=3402493 RepID=A0A9P0G560_9CUCU|nr:unnamed protein product [Psylliodes chrysocephala]
MNSIVTATNFQKFKIGWFAHPIYIGDYPQVMIDRIGQLSEQQGLCESRLPTFTRKEIQWIKDTHDFYALCYFRTVAVAAASDESCLSPSFSADSGAVITGPIVGDDTWGIKNIIIWVKNQYLNPSIFIINNGYTATNRTLEDYDRIEFIKNTLRNIRSAMINHDARVYGYTYHSYIDGFEWQFGYTLKFGLYDVVDNQAKTRTARRSAEYYQHVCKYGCIDENCPPRHHHQYYLDH